MDLLDISHILGKALGLYLVIIGIYLAWRGQKLHYAILDLFKNEPLIMLIGSLSLGFGLLILFIHPVFELNWRGLITLLFGIIPIIQGIVRLFFTSYARNYADKWSQGSGPLYCGISSIVVGAIIAYFGFMG